MNEDIPKSSSLTWLFPVIFLSIIAIMALYIVRDNFNERTKTPAEWVDKDTRSDYMAPAPMLLSSDTTSQKTLLDSTSRERGSQPVLDTLK